MTLLVACGSGPSGPKSAPVEPPPTSVAQIAVDAPIVDAPAPSRLACAAGTAPIAAPAPDPTWACARRDGTRHGAFLTVFPDDTIEITGEYKDGQLDGPWLRRHWNGAVAEHGSYTTGHKDGVWKQANGSGVALGEYAMSAGSGVEKHWYDEGPLYSEQAFKAGIEHGPLKVYARDGSVVISASYQDGKLDGPHVFGTRQSMRIEETFVGGVRRGKRGLWQFGLQVADEAYDRRGKLDGPYVLRRSGKVLRVKGAFAGGRRIGDWTWWDRDNNKERAGGYILGKKQGTWLEWWENRLVFSGSYAGGKPSGDFVYFDRNGNELGRFSMINGTGTMLTFHANRKVSSKQRMRAGALDGIYQELTPRAKVVVEGHYSADQKHGTWKEWTADGVLMLEQSWSRGKLDGPVKKYVDGKLAMETTYVHGKVSGTYSEFRNGKPALTGQFVDDQKDGTWTIYAADGAVLRIATYRAGVLEGPWRELVDGAVLEGPMVSGRRSGAWTRTDRGGAVRALTYTTP
ncbi:hypothetical protein BH11MYX3_BH11MYX3_32780 [soil metagenome]